MRATAYARRSPVNFARHPVGPMSNWVDGCCIYHRDMARPLISAIPMMLLLTASASQAIAVGQTISCQLNGLVITHDLTYQRINKTLLFQIDDSRGQLISGVNGVLATTMGFSDREILGQLRDVALAGSAAPSLFGNQLDSLDVSQSNFVLDRVSGYAVLSATFLSKAALFAVGPCGQSAKPQFSNFPQERQRD